MMAAGGMAAVRHLCMSGRSVKSPTPDILLRNRYKKQLNVKTWTRDLIRPRWSELFYFRPSQGSGKFKRRCTWGGRHAVCDRKYWWFMKGVTGLGANDNGKSTHTLMLLFVEDSAVCSCSPPSQENLSWGLDGGLPRPSRAPTLYLISSGVSLDKMPLTNSEICPWHSSLLALPFLCWQDN